MALFYQHNINENTRLGIWHIEEAENFFLEKVPLKRDVSHPHKRLQHLAGRYLLPFLFDDFPLEEILIADTRKPFLENEKYHFSISHAGNFAAAIVSSERRVGVDVEIITPKIERISHKFLSDDESELAAQSFRDQPALNNIFENATGPSLQTMLWSSKEAIFKWYGLGQLDFRKHIQLSAEINYAQDEWIKLPFAFLKDIMLLTVNAKIFNQLVLAWVMT